MDSNTNSNGNLYWRTALSQESRQNIVNKITDTLELHMPPTGPDGMTELRRIALRFEEKMYSAATDQQDYLRKISLKMLSLENHVTKPQVSSSGSNQKPQDRGDEVTRRLRNRKSEGAMDAANANNSNDNANLNWRTTLSQESRQKIINKIMDILQRHMSPTSPDGMTELRRIALRFEEKTYSVATDQQDYLRKISLKILSLQNHFTNPRVSSSAINQKPQDPASRSWMVMAQSQAAAGPSKRIRLFKAI